MATKSDNMKKIASILAEFLLIAATAALSAQNAPRPVDYVNPIIGTDGMGHTFPGA